MKSKNYTVKGKPKQATRTEIKLVQRELTQQILNSAVPGTITKAEARKAAKELVKAAQEQRSNTLKGTIRISNGVVDVSVSAVTTTATEETKSNIMN